ncbi:MAG: serine hydrolase domain-containing protein [Candidatus Odinarchaeota archaeon]
MMRKHEHFLLLVTVVSCFLASSAVVAGDLDIKAVYSDFKFVTPEEMGMDSSKLNEMDSYIKKSLPDFRSALVLRNGSLVFEKYYGITGTTRSDIYSVTKSFMSALIGIAIDKGYIDGVNVPIVEFFPEMTSTVDFSIKQFITLHHVLTMTTGLEWSELSVGYNDPNNFLFRMWNSPDWVKFVLDQKMVSEPGTTFNYNTGASHLLSAIITEVTGQSTLDFAEKELFEPLGIDPVEWPQDPKGIYRGGEGLTLTPRSLAKLGQLYLDNGSWDGTQIVPKDWVLESKIDYRPGDHTYGYGYQWWIHPDQSIFSAWGFAEQRVIIVPTYNLVSVFTAEMYNAPGDPGGDLVDNFVIPSIKFFDQTGQPTGSTSAHDNTGTSQHTDLNAAGILPFFLGVIAIKMMVYSRKKK